MASFVHAQNIAAVWNHCHPWQFWLNGINYFAGICSKMSDEVTLLSSLTDFFFYASVLA